MSGFEGQVALVTGASRGVGAAVAVALGAGGAKVACAARSTAAAPQRTPGTLDDTVARITAAGGTAVAVPTNLADEAEVELMVERTVAELGGLDILVNNAAVTFVGDLDIPLARHDLVMAINLQAPFVATRAAVPHLRAAGGGRILNVSSVAALLPVPGLMCDGIAVNCFRIDLPVASEGFVANTPGVDRSSWEPCEVAAEGVLWMLAQPLDYSGRRESMLGLRQREGIMASAAEVPTEGTPVTELLDGLAVGGQSIFAEPYEER
jgi:NAD(P)-dependent dehydrogenase (short-subunit alcohol dehydrogenase family)